MLPYAYYPYVIPLLNKEIPGLMKVEAGCIIIRFSVGLRSKICTLQISNGNIRTTKERVFHIISLKMNFRFEIL